MDWLGTIATVVSSGTVVSLITTLVNRRKTSVEVESQSIRTALELEERAHTRYTTAMQALDTAEAALNAARAELKAYEDYVEELQQLLEKAGLAYPIREFRAVR